MCERQSPGLVNLNISQWIPGRKAVYEHSSCIKFVNPAARSAEKDISGGVNCHTPNILAIHDLVGDLHLSFLCERGRIINIDSVWAATEVTARREQSVNVPIEADIYRGKARAGLARAKTNS